MNKYGVIFDMDGVISDTQSIQSSAEAAVLASYGIHVSPSDISAQFSGIYDKLWFKQLFEQYGIDADVAMAIEKKWKHMRERVDADGVRTISGVTKLIQALAADGYPLGIGSASPTHFIEFVVERLKLRPYFKSIHSAEDVERGKPEPDLFLLVAKELGIKPGSSVVIEDGRSGMAAAKSAGMKCIGLVDDTAEDYPADLLVTSLADVTPGTIEDLLNPVP